MYIYDKYDQVVLNERIIDFSNQIYRYLLGKLNKYEFQSLRLRNGLYKQRYGYMYRIAIPYGNLNSNQLRMIASIAKDYDYGYGHFSTRLNIQFNWIKLEDIPEILRKLSLVELNSIQTSGNCIRNITTDQFAGVSYDEIIDPRPWAEIIRQWSLFHPEFIWLPRKFKIAIIGSTKDRAVIKIHDLGIHLKKDINGNIVSDIFVGGGLGRNPIIGVILKKELSWKYLLTYIESILRVYNSYGDRNNLYKSRIKCLIKKIKLNEFLKKVNFEWLNLKNSNLKLTNFEVNRISNCFKNVNYKKYKLDLKYKKYFLYNINFLYWIKFNVNKHRINWYSSVVLMLKRNFMAPGDLTYKQMYIISDLSDKYSFGEIRVSHEQNLIFADVINSKLYSLWKKLCFYGFADLNVGFLTNIISCPGGDFCSLANAKSLFIVKLLRDYFCNIDYINNIGYISLNISGCMNSCGHHHIGNIGILGVDKKKSNWYQILIGGEQNNGFNDVVFGNVIGPSIQAKDVPIALLKIINVYIKYRIKNEKFINTYRRIGKYKFKKYVYN